MSPIDEDTLQQVRRFHGHMCPGLALGVHVAALVRRELGERARDEELVARVETDMCAVDAIQYLTGCTFGKGNLHHVDHGKNAYTFFRRHDGKAIRVAARPRGWERSAEHLELMNKNGRGVATEDERRRLWELHEAESRRILDRQPDELFSVEEVHEPVPPKARVMATVACQLCGEATMETRIRRLDGRELCPPCLDRALSGTEPVSLVAPPGTHQRLVRAHDI